MEFDQFLFVDLEGLLLPREVLILFMQSVIVNLKVLEHFRQLDGFHVLQFEVVLEACHLARLVSKLIFIQEAKLLSLESLILDCDEHIIESRSSLLTLVQALKILLSLDFEFIFFQRGQGFTFCGRGRLFR